METKQRLKQQKRNEKQEKINQLIKLEEEGAMIFRKQSLFGVKLNTDGFGMLVEIGRAKSSAKSSLYSIELGERYHPKEEKIFPTAASTRANDYVYGKINNFYYTKLGFGQQRLIANKGNKNGVAIFAVYGGGLTAALMKPYYLKVRYPRTIEDVRYSNNDSVFLDNSQLVLGATGFSKGLNEIKVTPGAFLKTALRIDYGRYNQVLSAVEVGLNIEVYSKKMEQILLVKNRQLFFNAYAAIEFGKRK